MLTHTHIRPPTGPSIAQGAPQAGLGSNPTVEDHPLGRRDHARSETKREGSDSASNNHIHTIPPHTHTEPHATRRRSSAPVPTVATRARMLPQTSQQNRVTTQHAAAHVKRTKRACTVSTTVNTLYTTTFVGFCVRHVRHVTYHRNVQYAANAANAANILLKTNGPTSHPAKQTNTRLTPREARSASQLSIKSQPPSPAVHLSPSQS